MPTKKTLVIYSIILFSLISPALTITVSSDQVIPPYWNLSWSYREEIKIPIPTDSPFAKLQPIDLNIKFRNPSWAIDEKQHSIRVCCWDGNQWHEIESQIYDLKHTSSKYINECRIVFLIPEIADGNEQYFIYYDKNSKPSPNYVDHIQIEDAYYYYEPISDISAEGDYYKITQDGIIVYGIGQKGQILDRKLSQAVINLEPNTKEFGIIHSDVVGSFAFSYQEGIKETDEVASDQKFVSKEIFIDGNLMGEVGVISKSSNEHLLSTNIYRYYYCPNLNFKRINVKVKHEVVEESIVEGLENVDGRFGALASLRSKSERIHRMRFGEILPYLHVYDESDNIRQYRMNLNPETNDREWIIPFEDDCDLGEEAWFSYDEGETGKAHAIIFYSNKNVVKQGTNETDGIQIKLAEKEYLDIVGAEVDYAAINFGRNSFEKYGSHDLIIPNDLVVEFNAELFTTLEGGYKNVIEEAKFFRELVKYREKDRSGLFEGDEDIYTLTVVPKITGRVLSHPALSDIAGFSLIQTWAELYKDDTLISTSYPVKPLFGAPVIKFPKTPPGEYLVKIYRQIGKREKTYIGVSSVTIEKDTRLPVSCTWEKNIKISTLNQYDKGIKDIELIILKNETTVAKNKTTKEGLTEFKIPFSLNKNYLLKAYYKGFIIHQKQIKKLQNKIEIKLPLYDLTIDIKDELDLPPGVDVRPFLTSPDMYNSHEITPENIAPGKYIFKEIPSAIYDLQISFGRFSNKKTITIPDDSDATEIKFNALFRLEIELFDSQGNSIQNNNQKIDIIRNGQIIHKSISPNKKINLPPAKYTINVYSNDELTATKNIQLTNDKNIKIVTTQKSIIPILITGLIIVFIAEIIVLLILKKISLNTFLKLLAMALILSSLFQPWWALNASSNDNISTKKTETFILPQVTIETVNYNGKTNLDLATIPEIFTNFLGALLFVVLSGFILMGISFLPNIFLKRRYAKILISASIIFLTIVAVAFSFGMSKICEIGLGSLQGEGPLEVTLSNGETVFMSANWGLGPGFYLCIIAAIITITAGLIDSIKKENWPKALRNNKILKF